MNYAVYISCYNILLTQWRRGISYSRKFLYGVNFRMHILHTKKHYETFEPSNFLMNFDLYSCWRGSY